MAQVCSGSRVMSAGSSLAFLRCATANQPPLVVIALHCFAMRFAAVCKPRQTEAGHAQCNSAVEIVEIHVA